MRISPDSQVHKRTTSVFLVFGGNFPGLRSFSAYLYSHKRLHEGRACGATMASSACSKPDRSATSDVSMREHFRRGLAQHTGHIQFDKPNAKISVQDTLLRPQVTSPMDMAAMQVDQQRYPMLGAYLSNLQNLTTASFDVAASHRLDGPGDAADAIGPAATPHAGHGHVKTARN